MYIRSFLISNLNLNRGSVLNHRHKTGTKQRLIYLPVLDHRLNNIYRFMFFFSLLRSYKKTIFSRSAPTSDECSAPCRFEFQDVSTLASHAIHHATISRKIEVSNVLGEDFKRRINLSTPHMEKLLNITHAHEPLN